MIVIGIFTALLIIAGIAGLFVPFLPDAPLVFVGILLYSIADKFENISWVTVVLLALLTAFLMISDFIASWYGIKRKGGSVWSQLFAMIGAVIGVVFWNIVGLVLGALIGGFLGEYIKESDEKKSLSVSFGGVLGFVVGFAFKVTAICAMIIIFIGALIF